MWPAFRILYSSRAKWLWFRVCFSSQRNWLVPITPMRLINHKEFASTCPKVNSDLNKFVIRSMEGSPKVQKKASSHPLCTPKCCLSALHFCHVYQNDKLIKHAGSDMPWPITLPFSWLQPVLNAWFFSAASLCQHKTGNLGCAKFLALNCKTQQYRREFVS